MKVSLRQLIPALESLGVDSGKIKEAIDALTNILGVLEDVEVKGRNNVDTMLGCMMAIDSIIGGDKNG